MLKWLLMFLILAVSWIYDPIVFTVITALILGVVFIPMFIRRRKKK